MRRAAKVDRFGVDTTNNAYKAAGVRTCEQCGGEYHSYNKARKYCGLTCRSKAFTRLGGRPCLHCGLQFKPNTEKRKYCSVECNKAAKPKTSFYVPRPLPRTFSACLECGTQFQHAPSHARKYCSYACFITSGGAQRAGDSAAMAKRKYGAKRDANHTTIFGAINAITAVKDLSNAGCGVPDGLAWVNGGWHLFDVKNPQTGYGRRGLNQRQKSWADDWRGGPVFLIYSPDEAIRFARGDFDGLKRFPEIETGGAD